MKNPFLWLLVLHCDFKCVFPSQKQLMNEHLLAMPTKMMERYVLLAIAKCATTTTSFDIWMSKSRCDIFPLIINFIDDQWIPCHVIIALFKAKNTSSVVLAIEVKSLLLDFNFTNKIIPYVKDERRNFNMSCDFF